MGLEELYPFKRNKPFIIATDDRCKECGGQCCCSGWPMYIGIQPYEFPFGKEVESLIKLLEGGFVRFDLRTYSAFIDNSDSKDNSCNCRTTEGCMFPPDMRPETCRTFVPNKTQGLRCGCIDSGEGELYLQYLLNTRPDVSEFQFYRDLWGTVFKNEIDKEDLMKRFPKQVFRSEDRCAGMDCDECGNC